MLWYFAYGSNMNPARLVDDRLMPKGVALGRRVGGRLDGWRLAFDKVARSPKGSGVGNIVAIVNTGEVNQHLVSTDGTVGYNMRLVRASTVDWNARSVFIATTDGSDSTIPRPRTCSRSCRDTSRCPIRSAAAAPNRA